jgi:hypothetical protein
MQPSKQIQNFDWVYQKNYERALDRIGQQKGVGPT